MLIYTSRWEAVASSSHFAVGLLAIFSDSLMAVGLHMSIFSFQTVVISRKPCSHGNPFSILARNLWTENYSCPNST